MPRTVKQSGAAKLRFGGGINSRASEEDIHELECSAGQNFALDAGNLQYRPRPPFDLVGTVGNGGEIRGGATLLKSDGTVSTLIQSDDTVYEWTSGPTFTDVGSVSSNAQLRGRLEHQWQLSDKVIITDLNNVDPVKEWDGTTFQSVSFTDENDASFGTFRAKYCYVENERAVFANIHDNGTDFPHLIVGSKRGDYTQITTTNRPSSSLSAEDPWFLVQPDNYAINGLVEAFRRVILSSQCGSMYDITGADATDFAISLLAERAAAEGDEAVHQTNNDIVYGRQGRIESLSGVEKFGDVNSNDISFWIEDSIEDYSDWTIAHNKRTDVTYYYPAGKNEIWAFYNDTFNRFGGEISPWSKFVTAHALNFAPTFMMPMLDPTDGLEYIILGDSGGNVYKMEGTESGGDGGSAAIKTNRLSRLLSATAEGDIHNTQGYVRYRKKNSVTATIKFKWSGERQYNSNLTMTLDAGTFDPVYGTTAYYGTTKYYGFDDDRLAQERFEIPGGSNTFQVDVEIDDTGFWTINEIGLRFEETS